MAFLTLLAVSGLGGALVLFWLAAVGPRWLDRPVCGRCRSDVRSWSEPLSRCRHCGAPLDRRGAVQFGPRRRRFWLLAPGAGLLLGGVLALRLAWGSGDAPALPAKPVPGSLVQPPSMEAARSLNMATPTQPPTLELWRPLPLREGWAFEVMLSVAPGQEIDTLESVDMILDGHRQRGLVREASTRGAEPSRLFIAIVDLPATARTGQRRAMAVTDSPQSSPSRRTPAPSLSELRLAGRLKRGERFSWRYSGGRGEVVAPSVADTATGDDGPADAPRPEAPPGSGVPR